MDSLIFLQPAGRAQIGGSGGGGGNSPTSSGMQVQFLIFLQLVCFGFPFQHFLPAASRSRRSPSAGQMAYFCKSSLPANKQVQVPGHPSDSEEPATASDSSSGADPWTVVTSPSRRTAPAMPAAVPENPLEVAEPQTAAGSGPGGAGGNAEAAGEPAAAAEPAAVKSSGSGADGGAAASPAKVPQASPVEAAAPAAAVEEAAGPAQESDGEEDDLDDIEVAVDGNDEDVDEDWGYTTP